MCNHSRRLPVARIKNHITEKARIVFASFSGEHPSRYSTDFGIGAGMVPVVTTVLPESVLYPYP